MHSPLRFGNTVFPRLAFIGAGNMAKAIIAGLIKTGYPKENICVSAPSVHNRSQLNAEYGVSHHDDNIKNANEADVIILAVKPQMMQIVCENLKETVNFKDKLIITLAAGIEVNRYNTWLGAQNQIVRVMPNTPSLIGEGISGIYAPEYVSETAINFVKKLMKSVGLVHVLDEESMMHSFIATAGSAPAYFFVFMQAIEKAAIEFGFTQGQAQQLVLQTAKGAVLLADNAKDKYSFQNLSEQVTSKGGTTEQALKVFTDQHLSETVFNAMKAAADKSDELSKRL